MGLVLPLVIYVLSVIVKSINEFHLFITARKRSLGQGNIFTGVCLSTGGVPGPGGCLVLGGAWSRGRGGAWSRGRGVPAPGGGVPGGDPQTATAAGDTHPTGMHSCLNLKYKAASEKTVFIQKSAYLMIYLPAEMKFWPR